MAEINPPTWLANGCYDAQNMRLSDAMLVCGEGYVPGFLDEMEVGPVSGEPLLVQVESGGAWVDADLGGECQGVYGVVLCPGEQISVSPGDPVDDRIDLVVAKVRDATFEGSTSSWELLVVEGTAAPSPVAPPAPDNSVALAEITITSAGITQITDRRTAYQQCGSSSYSREVYSSEGSYTYTVPSTARILRVHVVGGGGGGGGAGSTGSDESSGGSGGGGGGYVENVMDTGVLGSSVSITVGGGGVGGADGSTNPTAGESSLFGSLMTAVGGEAGVSGNATSGNFRFNGGEGGEGSATSPAAVIYRGSPGEDIACFNGGGYATGGAGGASGKGGGGSKSAGTIPRNGMMGGGGSGITNNANKAAKNGGDGGDGFVIVEVIG